MIVTPKQARDYLKASKDFDSSLKNYSGEPINYSKHYKQMKDSGLAIPYNTVDLLETVASQKELDTWFKRFVYKHFI